MAILGEHDLTPQIACAIIEHFKSVTCVSVKESAATSMTFVGGRAKDELGLDKNVVSA